MTLILLILSQIAESRAGGGGDDVIGGLEALVDFIEAIIWISTPASTSSETFDANFFIFMGIVFSFLLIINLYDLYYSIERKVDKKHKEIIEKLANDPDAEFMWDENEIISNVKQSFIDLQIAWSEQDLDFIERKLSQDLFVKWRDMLTFMRNQNKWNKVSNVIVNKIRFVKLDKQEKIFTVFIDAKEDDITVDIDSGVILKDQSGGFKEFWTYMWGIDGWILTEINQLGESSKFL